MSDYPLIIAAYARGTDWQTKLAKPYHWALFIRADSDAGKDAGITHQLHGMPGGFHYDGAEATPDVHLLGAKCNEVDIGRVPRTKLDAVTAICSAVAVDQSESSGWNCQSWTVSAVEMLKKEGFIDEWITEEYLRGYLKELES